MSTSELIRALMAKVEPNPTIAPGQDGNIIVSAAEMQKIYDLLRFSISEAEGLSTISRSILSAQPPFSQSVLSGTPTSSMIDILTLSRRAPSLLKELRGIRNKLEGILPFKGDVKEKIVCCRGWPPPSVTSTAPLASVTTAQQDEEDLYA